MAIILLLTIFANQFISSWQSNEASEVLKAHYRETIGATAESTLGKRTTSERIFVNVTLLRTTDIIRYDDEVLVRVDNIKKVEISELLGGDYKFVILKGVGGVGKTHLMEHITLQWANGLLWGNIRYVFLLKCHEMLRLNIPDIKGMLRVLYANAFHYISYDDIIQRSNETLVIIDGLDELLLNNSNPFDALDLIDPEKNQLPHLNVIVTGRHESVEIFKRRYHKYEQKEFDIVGFTERSVDEYVEAMLDKNATAVKMVKDLIKRNRNLHVISRIPEYLKLICEICESYQDIVIETITELFV